MLEEILDRVKKNNHESNTQCWTIPEGDFETIEINESPVRFYNS